MSAQGPELGPPSAAPASSDPDRRDGPGVDPARGLWALRLAIGIIWSLNLIFIVDPANGFFSGFASTAQGFAGQSVGGAILPDLVAAHPMVFAALIAGVTAYLAAAFLLGVTVRWACGVGIFFASVLLISQFGGTFVIPGGTDVGPMPLYIGIYAALLWGRADRLKPVWTLVGRPLGRSSRAGLNRRPELTVVGRGEGLPRVAPPARSMALGELRGPTPGPTAGSVRSGP